MIRKIKPKGPPTVKDVLKTATKLISNGGWTQHSYRRATDEGMKYCAIGAIEKAMEDVLGKYDSTMFSAAVGKIYLHLPPEFSSSIVSYNDTTGRTASEVIEVFKKAAKEA